MYRSDSITPYESNANPPRASITRFCKYLGEKSSDEDRMIQDYVIALTLMRLRPNRANSAEVDCKKIICADICNEQSGIAAGAKSFRVSLQTCLLLCFDTLSKFAKSNDSPYFTTNRAEAQGPSVISCKWRFSTSKPSQPEGQYRTRKSTRFDKVIERPTAAAN